MWDYKPDLLLYLLNCWVSSILSANSELNDRWQIGKHEEYFVDVEFICDSKS